MRHSRLRASKRIETKGCITVVRPSRRAPSSSLGQALWALLRIRQLSDSIKPIPHPEEPAKRPSRMTHYACPAALRFLHTLEGRDLFPRWAPAPVPCQG